MATIDTSTFVFSYNKDPKRKRIDCYLENEIYIYVIYEYDKRGRIRAITDNFVLKVDYNGYSKGDIADKIEKRFSYKKGAKFPKHVKRLFGSVGQRGIRNTQLEFKAKSSFEFNDKGQLFRILKNAVGEPKSIEEFTYDYAKKTIWIKSILYTKSGDILEYTIENRYDELVDIQFSLNLAERFHLPNIDNFRFRNNIIYSKMIYGKNYKYKEYRGKVAHEYEMSKEYNEKGLISKSIKKVIDHFDKDKIGEVYTSIYEYTCE